MRIVEITLKRHGKREGNVAGVLGISMLLSIGNHIESIFAQCKLAEELIIQGESVDIGKYLMQKIEIKSLNVANPTWRVTQTRNVKQIKSTLKDIQISAAKYEKPIMEGIKTRSMQRRKDGGGMLSFY